MNKDQIVTYVAECAGVSKPVARRCIDCYHKAINGALQKGEKVTLVGFGTFSTAKRVARTGRDPQTGAKIQIPATTVPKFKAGKKLREAV